MPSASTAETKLGYGAPTFGGTSLTPLFAKAAPKSSRAGRVMKSGKWTPGSDRNSVPVDSAVTAVPSDSRGTALGGGSTPSLTQRSRLTSAARSRGA